MESNYNIKPIKKMKLSDEVFSQMKKNILLNIWDEGTQLPSEKSLSELFQVSRTTIRAAVNRLGALGLVETRNGEGTFVISKENKNFVDKINSDIFLKNQDINELLEFRQGIEKLSCKLAAKRRDEHELLTLKLTLNNMSDAIKNKNIADYSQADIDFHKEIAKMSKNKIIEGVLETLEDLMLSKVKQMNEELGLELGYNYHRRIYKAIEDMDSENAEKLIEENLNKSMEAISQKI